MQRLKTRPQFQATLDGGTVARTPHFALHRLAIAVPDAAIASNSMGERPDPDSASRSTAGAQSVSPRRVGEKQVSRVALAPLISPDAVWLGAMVPKRWARRAVTRNAIKRQIYGVGSMFESRLPVAAHVVRLRAAFDRKQFVSAHSDALKSAVRDELHVLFERASQSIALS